MKEIWIQKMASEITAACELIFGYSRCTFPNNTIDLDLKTHELRCIHTCKKDSSQVNKYSSWGIEITPFPSLQKKINEYMRWRETVAIPFSSRLQLSRLETVTTPFTEKLYQSRSEAAQIKGHTLVTLKRSNKDSVWQ